ncbi:hypothetical protein BBR47_36930 [Brevibacillus brevis NBRC 100599]|uniref:Uncharacterized protein n=1 Tax=Brevibacillus brevis (strain 47 / JCM 6285 / NBRC 100599) TaxID=358681 RepID=C0ZFW1_BREBN|nr:hypothetical protein BBR47_36930 [Brevibacillus brevis NBRC 100599]
MPYALLLLLLALFFLEAFHAECTIVIDFILGQASLTRLACFFREH